MAIASAVTGSALKLQSRARYCTVRVTCRECAIPPSVAVTVTVKLPSFVGCRIWTVPLPDLLESACDAAFTLIAEGLGTLEGAL